MSPGEPPPHLREEDGRMPCPSCRGRRYHVSFNTKGGAFYERHHCPLCGATGKITPAVLERVRLGEERMRLRVKSHQLPEDAARALGVTTFEYLQMERGIIPFPSDDTD